MILVGYIIGAFVLVGIGVAIGASGDDSRPLREQLAVQRAENERLQRTAVKLATENARLRADDDLVYMQGFADGQAFERQMLPEPSLN